MSGTSPSLRKRGGKKEADYASDDASSPLLAGQGGSVAPKHQSEWSYRLAMAILTVLAFITRFWGISYPNEVIFDEVHFGKVSSNADSERHRLNFGCFVLVCLILPPTHLLLRRPPSVR